MTVSQLNEYLKALFDHDKALACVWVKGEISNFSNNYKSGHFYFSIKDESSLLRVVMFKSAASKLTFLPENGMKVILKGRVSLFVRDGTYQLYAEELEPDGIGSLYIAFEQLKKKLAAEGLFDPARKRPLPKIPTRIGIITSPTGAAIRDMINISGRRFPYAKITLFPSLVQGEEAPVQLMKGIAYFNRTASADVIILGRGGGSIEDLWAFNDEALARAVANSRIPVISAVGHESDFTICDFVADVRAPTPSAAAEIALPEVGELKRKINNIIGRMSLLLSSKIKQERAVLARLETSRILSSPLRFLDDRRMTLLSLNEILQLRMQALQTQRRAALAANAGKLDALNPLAVFSRGYTAVYDEEGTLIKSVKQISEGDHFRFDLPDGTVHGTVDTLTAKRKD